MNDLTVTVNALTTTKTLEELEQAWIEYLDVSPKTLSTYQKAIKSFAVWMNENGITHPERGDIVQYRDYLKQKKIIKKTKKGQIEKNLSASTISLYMTTVRLFFSWLEQEGYYRNVANRIKGAKIDRIHKKDPMSKAQVNDLINSIGTETEADLRDRAMLITMFTTGLRTVSIAAADIQDIRTLPTGEPCLYFIGKGREEKAKYVKLCPAADRAIRAYLKVRNPGSDTEPLFKATSNRSQTGRMRTDSISRIFKTRCRAIGIDSERISAHCSRHTFSTQALLEGAKLEEVQQALDHQNIQTTLLYSHALQRASNNTEMIVGYALFEE